MILSVVNCKFFCTVIDVACMFMFFAFFHLFFVESLSSFVVLGMSFIFCCIDAAVDCFSFRGRFVSSISLISFQLVSNNSTVLCFVENFTI